MELARQIFRKPTTLIPSMAFSLAALFLYIPANICPFMEITLYGVRTKTTVWDGVVSLTQEGSWFVAVVVLLASIVIPLFKLMTLFLLTASSHNNWFYGKRTRMYQFVEVIGRWSMLDIFLLAILVSAIKLRGWAYVSPGSGSLAFVGVVIFTMLATSNLTPELIGEGNSHDRT